MKEIRYDSVTEQFTFAEKIGDRLTQSVRPQKFSLNDKYATYRRKGMEQQRKDKGLLE